MVAACDVLAERERQKTAEGWTAEHDDQHDAGQLAAAASCYAQFAVLSEAARWRKGILWVPDWWPWSRKWWKPTNSRRDLVKAGALILAEIERLDRRALAPSKTEGQSRG